MGFDLIADKNRRTYTELVAIIKPYDFVTPWVIHQGAFPVDVALKAIESSGHSVISPVEDAVWWVEQKRKVDFLCKYVHHFKQDGKYFAENTGQGELWNIDSAQLSSIGIGASDSLIVFYEKDKAYCGIHYSIALTLNTEI